MTGKKYTKRKLLRKRREREKFEQNVKRGLKTGGILAAVGASIAPFAQMPLEVEANTTGNYASNAYIDQLGACAQKVAGENGLYASVMIAQALVERGWGSSTLSQAPYNNLFGIKGEYNGNSVTMKTMEYIGGKWVSIDAAFRAYPSFLESFEDNARVLKTTNFGNGAFYSGAWKAYAPTYQDATKWLTGRYATDPTYNVKLNNLISTYNLTRFDSGSGAGVATDTAQTTPTSTQPAATGEQKQTYKVESGDSVWGIAHKFGITMDTLIALNNIQNNFVYPGQELTIKEGAEAPAQTSTPAAAPQADVASPIENSGADTTYTVQSGDSVWGIAHRFNTTMDNIIGWNNIKNYFVYPGQKVIVAKGQESSSQASAPQAQSGNNTYTVKSGDSLWMIAQNNDVSIDQIKQLSGITSDTIFIGQKLTLR
jgi:LysM repeat protein